MIEDPFGDECTGVVVDWLSESRRIRLSVWYDGGCGKWSGPPMALAEFLEYIGLAPADLRAAADALDAKGGTL